MPNFIVPPSMALRFDGRKRHHLRAVMGERGEPGVTGPLVSRSWWMQCANVIGDPYARSGRARSFSQLGPDPAGLVAGPRRLRVADKIARPAEDEQALLVGVQ